MTCVCSVGLDMIAIPGDTPAEVISGIIADNIKIKFFSPPAVDPPRHKWVILNSITEYYKFCSPKRTAEKVYDKITKSAKNLVKTANELSSE